MAGVLAAAGAAGLLAAAVVLVDGGPGPGLGLLVRNAFLFVAFRDVVGLAFLFVGVFGLVSARHGDSPGWDAPPKRRLANGVPVTQLLFRRLQRRDPNITDLERQALASAVSHEIEVE